LIQMYPDKDYLVDSLVPVVQEEWSHFRSVLEELRKKGYSLGKPRKDLYVVRLREFIIKGGSPEDRLLDHLLVCALIEARSCERFRLLSEGLQDETYRKFYRSFMVSEAGHYRLFKEIAQYYLPKERVEQRWQEFLEHEAEVMKWLEIRGDRIH
ncbi:MAG: tRNA 2-methylthio-N6-isopentenyl adenosine(37) hydroxylase MiaE, partial [Planctomycetota bacterium]